VPSNQQEKLQELVKAGKLERVPFKAKIFAQQIQSCSQSRTDAQALLIMSQYKDHLYLPIHTSERLQLCCCIAEEFDQLRAVVTG